MLLRKLNMNLLKTLNALLETRNITVASQQLFVTQPAVSTALKQLREIFDDPLLIRGEDNSLILTHKSKSLRPLLQKILADTQSLLNYSGQAVDLKTLDITLTIGVHNHVVILLISHLFERLNDITPRIKVKQNYITDISKLSEQNLSQYDYIIGAFSAPQKQFITRHYYDDEYVCFSGNKMLNQKKSLTKKDINTHEHVVISYVGSNELDSTEKLLRQNGIKRNYRVTVASQVLAAQLAEKEGLLLIALKNNISIIQRSANLKVFSLPGGMAPVKNYILQKRVDIDNPEKNWFMDLLDSTNPSRSNDIQST